MALRLIDRNARALVVEALRDTRVVFVMGARQVGKSTLVNLVARQDYPARVLTLDDQATRQSALADPTGFVAELPEPVVLDEVQRAPELLLAIKEAVDRDTRPGRFLLTGSANVLTNRNVKDALTGRMEIVTLWPLSQAEINGSTSNIIDALFASAPPEVADAVVGRDAFVETVATGGYPEARQRGPTRRDRWFRDYVDTTLDRDLRDVSDALKLHEMPRLLRLLGAQAAGLLNYKSVADRLQLHPDTVKSYVQLLETVFLVHRLPAWRPGLGSREVHSPKLHFVDSGLLAHVLGADASRIRHDDQVTGRIVENFVVMEILKHAQWARHDVRVHHYRNGRDELDVVLENRAGEIVAVEVKASASTDTASIRSLAKLRDSTGERFRAGAVLYTGRQTVPQGERIWAVPLCALWQPPG
ncbi:MAG TPA: ATP-binding protein [Acidimicrobiales bacterium]|jgi:predicted AAA+ superfamily ATPase